MEKEPDQILVKQLKNRYNDLTVCRKFVLGIARDKMKLFDLDDKQQEGLVDSNQHKGADDKFVDAIFDQTAFGEGWKV